MSDPACSSEEPRLDDDLSRMTPSPENLESFSGQPSPNQGGCEMCHNYETNLTIMQDNERKLREELKAVKELSDRYEKELSNERDYRREMEKRFAESTEKAEEKIKLALTNHSKMASAYDSLKDRYNETVKKVQDKATRNREKYEQLTAKHVATIDKYKALLGVNRMTARAMQEEVISIPEGADLQIHCLGLREQLIEARAALEHLRVEKTDVEATLRAQLQEEAAVRDSIEKALGSQITELQTEVAIGKSDLTSAATTLAAAEEQKRQIVELQATITELEGQVQQVQDQRKAVEQTAQNYKARCSSLQQELDTCEMVQKDFVKLSQSLQIQLEKIRASEQEVRWQFDDDVDNCQECSAALNRTKPKPHCRHCGRIFCTKCLSNSVSAGPARRPASVCQVCHTLLNPDSAPFFSKEN
ncbi:unnamed protein product, partial [Mesorhabditis spiculigera]